MFTHLARRICALPTRNADLTDELRFHLEQEAAALEREGMSGERARAEALRRG